MKSSQTSMVGVSLAILLIVAQLFLLLKLFTLMFATLLFLMVTIAFLKEENRVLAWTVVGFIGGMFAFIYGDRILLELPTSNYSKYIWNRLLLLVPIIAVYYIGKKFGKKPASFPIRVKIEKWGLQGKVLKGNFQFLLVFQGALLLYYIIKSLPLSSQFLWFSLGYALLSAVFMELLWRGLLLMRLRKLIGSSLAVIFTSLSSAIAYYSFGYSLLFCLFFFLVGILLGVITFRMNNMMPAILYHFLLALTFMMKNSMPFVY